MTTSTHIEFADATELQGRTAGLLATAQDRPFATEAYLASHVEQEERQPGCHRLEWAVPVDGAMRGLVPLAVALLATNPYFGIRETHATDLGTAIGMQADCNPRHAAAVVKRVLLGAAAALKHVAEQATKPSTRATDVVPSGRPEEYAGSCWSNGTETQYGMGYAFRRPARDLYAGHDYANNDRSSVLAEPVTGTGQRFLMHDGNDGLRAFLSAFGIVWADRSPTDKDRYCTMPGNMANEPSAARGDVVAHVERAYRIGLETIREIERKDSHDGEDSWFDDRSNAERDELARHLAAGGTATLTRIENWWHEDDITSFVALDGTDRQFHGNAAVRLQKAGLAAFGKIDGDSRRPRGQMQYTLTVTWHQKAKKTREAIAPATGAVLFDGFQTYCGHRRHPESSDGRECAHRKNSAYSSYCDSGGCPITKQVYADDQDEYNSDRDPFFERENEREGMVLVRAIHPNTERTIAWKLAGEARIHAIVNRCAEAVFLTGGKSSRYLTTGAEELAGHAAIAAGHLVLDETIGFGSVFRLNDALHAEMTARYAQATAASAAAPATTA